MTRYFNFLIRRGLSCQPGEEEDDGRQLNFIPSPESVAVDAEGRFDPRASDRSFLELAKNLQMIGDLLMREGGAREKHRRHQPNGIASVLLARVQPGAMNTAPSSDDRDSNESRHQAVLSE